MEPVSPPLSALRAQPTLARPTAGAAPEAVRRMAEEFEGLVVAELLAPMFEALDTEGLGGGGAGERMFRPMLIQEYAKSLAQSGGIGLAEALTRDLLRLQTESAP